MKILEYISSIVKTISENPVTQVKAPTGVGKSTMIPYFLAEGSQVRVFVSVPTRSGVMALYQFISHTFPQVSIGYASEATVNYTPKTKIIYSTSGHLRRKMLGLFQRGSVEKAGIDFCDVLIIDEAHSGSIDNTVIVSLWMEAFRMGKLVPRLVLLSATPSHIPVEPVPVNFVVDVPHPFDIQVEYVNPKIRNLDRDVAVLIDKAIDVAVASTDADGDVLLFVAGSAQVEKVVSTLRGRMNKATVRVAGAYSAMQKEDMAILFEPAIPGTRRIIVSTNIAESSITIDGIGLVIDTLIANVAGTSPMGGFRLATEYISKDSAEQRLGRTGRTRGGRCVRIMSEENYEKLTQHSTPEIERVPLHEVVIELINAHLDPVTIIKGIDPMKVRRSIEVLRELDMLREDKAAAAINRNMLYEVLPQGRFAPEVPLSVYNAAFLFRWIEKGLPVYPGIVIATLIDVFGPSYFYFPKKEEGETPVAYAERLNKHIEENIRKYVGFNPIETYLNLYEDLAEHLGVHLKSVVMTGNFNREAYPLYSAWLKTSSANGKKIKEFFSIIRQVYNSILRIYVYKKGDREAHGVQERERIPIKYTIGKFSPANAMGEALPILTDVYKSKMMTKIHGVRYRDANGALFNLNNRQVVSLMEAEENAPTHIIALNTAQIGNINVISLAIPVKIVGEDGQEYGEKEAGKQEEKITDATIADIFA